MGHAATYTAWDLLVRAWLDARHTVHYVQNVTDVDDPLLERAERDGEDWRELAERETQLFREDMTALRMLPPQHYIGAVEAMPVIVRSSTGCATAAPPYDVDDDVYFAGRADPRFGALSGLDRGDDAGAVRRARRRPGPPRQEEPARPAALAGRTAGRAGLGLAVRPGRPGWHVECAAIAAEYLGHAFDVQAGGSDLVFPHHEMSASHAQVARPASARSPGRTCTPGWSAYDGEKMSKSLGNLVFVSALRGDGVDPMAIRLALLAHHYRSDWEWTDAVLADAQARLARWRAALAHAEAAAGPEPGSAGPARPSAGGAPAELVSPACARGCTTTSTPRARWPSSTAGPTPCWPRPPPASPPPTWPAPASSGTPSTPSSASACSPASRTVAAALSRARVDICG